MSDAFAPGLAHPPPNRQPTDPSPAEGTVPEGRDDLGVRRFRRLPMRWNPRNRSAGAGSRIWTSCKLRFARFSCGRSRETTLGPLVDVDQCGSVAARIDRRL
jgi:hypothetical protein